MKNSIFKDDHGRSFLNDAIRGDRETAGIKPSRTNRLPHIPPLMCNASTRIRVTIFVSSKNSSNFSDISTTMVYTHVLNRGGLLGVQSPIDRL